MYCTRSDSIPHSTADRPPRTGCRTKAAGSRTARLPAEHNKKVRRPSDSPVHTPQERRQEHQPEHIDEPEHRPPARRLPAKSTCFAGPVVRRRPARPPGDSWQEQPERETVTPCARAPEWPEAPPVSWLAVPDATPQAKLQSAEAALVAPPLRCHSPPLPREPDPARPTAVPSPWTQPRVPALRSDRRPARSVQCAPSSSWGLPRHRLKWILSVESSCRSARIEATGVTHNRFSRFPRHSRKALCRFSSLRNANSSTSHCPKARGRKQV